MKGVSHDHFFPIPRRLNDHNLQCSEENDGSPLKQLKHDCLTKILTDQRLGFFLEVYHRIHLESLLLLKNGMYQCHCITSTMAALSD